MEVQSVKSRDKAKASMVQEKIENLLKKANELLKTVTKLRSSLSNENKEVKP